MSKCQSLVRPLALGALAVGAASGTAALVPLGRPQLPLPSADWALLATVTGSTLIGLFGLQTALIALTVRRPLADAVRATAWSFSPLLLLWPLLLGVTFWDTANHWFVYHPGLGLWWGGVAFVFAVAQVALLPVELDGGWPAPGATRGRASEKARGPTPFSSWASLIQNTRAALRLTGTGDPPPLLVIVFAYTMLRLTVRFGFETARFIEASRPFNIFYNQVTLIDAGVYPYLHRWSEYPPGFPWLSTGVYRAVSFFGVTFERYYAAITLALLPFGIGTLVLVYKLTELAWDRRRALYAGWAFTALAVPIHDWMRQFTTAPLFFLLLAVYLVVERRRHTAMLAVILGALMKIVPVAGTILALRATGTWRGRVGLAALGSAWLALGLAPFWLAGRTWFEASLGNMLSRPPWGTAWALLDGHYGSGWVNPYRLHPEFATDYEYVGRIPDWLWFAPLLALGAFYLWLAWRPRPVEDARTQVRVAFVSLLAFLLYLKGWSPSFVNWVLPFLIVVYPSGRGVILAAGLSALELFWRPTSHALGVPEVGLIGSVTWRTLLFLSVGADLICQIRRAGAARTPSVPRSV